MISMPSIYRNKWQITFYILGILKWIVYLIWKCCGGMVQPSEFAPRVVGAPSQPTSASWQRGTGSISDSAFPVIPGHGAKNIQIHPHCTSPCEIKHHRSPQQQGDRVPMGLRWLKLSSVVEVKFWTGWVTFPVADEATHFAVLQKGR